MKVLVVTITCNRLGTTQKWLGSLRENTELPFHHVVVDNGSTDSTANWLLEAEYDTVALPRNEGIMAGWIAGWRHATFQPDVVVKCDDDVEVITPNLLDRLVAFVEQGDRVAAPYNVTLGRVPAPMGDSGVVAGERSTPTRMVGGMLVAVPGGCFSQMVKTGGMKGDMARGKWWRENGYQPYYLTDLRAAHHGRKTIDRKSHGGYVY